MIEESFLLEKVGIEMTTLGVVRIMVARTMVGRTILEVEAVGTMEEAVVMEETIYVVNQVNFQARLGAMAGAMEKHIRGLIRTEEKLFVKQ